MMMTSSNISAHDLLIDHPFSGIHQLVSTPSDHDHHDIHGHGGHYCHNWVSHHHHHHHHDLDQHINKQAGSDHDHGLNNHTMDAENGSIETWTWEHNNDLYNYDPMVGSVDINSDDDIHDNWLPNSSKLKIVKKMNPKRASNSNTTPPMVEIATDEYFPYFLQADQNDSNSINSGSNGNHNINTGIRVCSDCHTTKTPLWRSGPNGPKSLCNACGIRQRKARRALAAAAAAGGGGGSVNNALPKATSTTSNPKSLKIKISDHKFDNTKEKKTSTTCGHEDTTQGWQQPYKKRLKHSHHHHQNSYTSASQDSNGDDDERNDSKRMCFEEFITISLSKNAALHRVFPQDEKEAAILLMAMSCGLVHN